MLLTNKKVSKFRKAFENDSSGNIKLSKNRLHKIKEWGGFLGRLLVPFLTTGLPLIGNVIKLLVKSDLISLGLTAAASATDAAIHKKMFGSGTTTLIISSEEMNDIIKIINSLEESGLLIMGARKIIEANKWSKRTKKRVSRNVIRCFRC